jgi:uncharacterized metal-binding protein
VPSGKIHSALNLAIATGVLVPYALVNWMDGNPYMYIAGNLVGILISPDLDVDAGNVSDSIIRKVSRPAQWIWRKFWTPYSLALPHRSTLSHFPVLSTLIRLGYIVVGLNLFLMVGWGVSRIVGWDDSVSFVFLWDWSFFMGLVHVDTVHWLADKTIKGREQFTDE